MIRKAFGIVVGAGLGLAALLVGWVLLASAVLALAS